MLSYNAAYFRFILLFTITFLSIFHASHANTVLDKRSDKKWQQKKQDMLTLGQAMFDILYKFDDEKEYQQYLKKAKVKNGSVSVIDKETLTQLIQKIPSASQPGGSASNTTAGLATLGGKVAFLGVIGGDDIGHQYLEGMKEYGIRNLMKKIYNSDKSGAIIVLISPNGERTMLPYPGLSKNITVADIDPKLISKYKIAFTEGYMWSDAPENNTAIKEFYRAAKASGGITAFTFGDHSLVTKYKDKWLELVKEIDIIFSDNQQIYALFETNDWEKIKTMMRNYNAIFIVTFGKKGAYIVHHDQQIFIPPPNVSQVVDTTGAGDQFAAGFLYGYLKNLSLEECGKLGATTAGHIIQQVGAKPRVPFAESMKAELSLIKK